MGVLFSSTFSCTCGKLPSGQGAFSVRCPDPQQLSAPVVGSFFLFNHPVPYGKASSG